jgi:hypothetical protein
MQVVRERRIGREPEGDEQRPGLAAQERRGMVVLVRREVRRRTIELERTPRGAGEIEQGLGMAASSQRVQRPDDAGCTGVQALQRERRLPHIPFVNRP